MMDTEFRAWMEQQTRQNVIYPQAEKQQRLIEELQRINSAAVPQRGPRRRLGGALIGCGLALAAAGRRLQGLEREAPSPSS
ncbi:MAG TPA: hypothetical protein VKV26_02350 [Dehalococcoidia bacterium]|nr:hypothetical protein [Dehalococcoidia bacterium]